MNFQVTIRVCTHEGVDLPTRNIRVNADDREGAMAIARGVCEVLESKSIISPRRVTPRRATSKRIGRPMPLVAAYDDPTDTVDDGAISVEEAIVLAQSLNWLVAE